ncbi:allophanate hydrolase [Paenibacillus sp. EPM92]|uniref:allophanate hydrolase n=1 Tax=Paenibacillus sp. EPM92 TaxID=1561195 RepID=UPI0019153CED|nr:allophanate hydrolase [Paenibacillus sp. EPM92]
MNTRMLPRELSISWLREMYQNNVWSPEEVVNEIINRAAEDAEMNIWITPPSMKMIQPYLDRLKLLDKGLAPLWGIPFAIKDNIDLAHVPTTAGCPDFEYTPTEHATVVERLIEAGAIPVGKANLDQFATGLVGVRSPYGETKNALRGELISGGSSSGSAVAVARGHAAFALGTDTAGSGRVPAALNRLVGYKPTLGAWSTKGVVPACAGLDCVSVLAHSLEDALAVDAVARGVDHASPWSRSFPAPTPALPRKIYLPKEPLNFFGTFANEYSQAWDLAVERLKKLGIPVEYTDTSKLSQTSALLYDGPFVAERWAGLGDFVEAHPGSALPVTEQILRSGATTDYSAASLFKAWHTLQAHKLEVRRWLADAVLILPTCAGTWTLQEVRNNPITANSAMGLYTNHCNLLDLCAVAVPAEDAAPNTPFGITMFALAENEALICGAAACFADSSANLAGVDLTTELKPVSRDMVPVAVCGLHMRGYPLEKQMKEFGARFVRDAATAAKYQMIKLPTDPAKPGLIRKEQGGASIRLELWEMPTDRFGAFAAAIPAPLGIGKIELLDGVEVPGFICEAYAAAEAVDITSYGGWRNAVEAV